MSGEKSLGIRKVLVSAYELAAVRRSFVCFAISSAVFWRHSCCLSNSIEFRVRSWAQQSESATEFSCCVADLSPVCSRSSAVGLFFFCLFFSMWRDASTWAQVQPRGNQFPRRLNSPNGQPDSAAHCWQNQPFCKPIQTSFPPARDLDFLYISFRDPFWPSAEMPRECQTRRCGGVRLARPCSGSSQLRLVDGGEYMLHLNDVIISDAASCNQGRSTQRGIHREMLYAWMENRSKEALISFVLPPSAAKQEEERWLWSTNKSKDDDEGITGLHPDSFDSHERLVS